VVTVATDEGPELFYRGFGELVVLGAGREYGCCGGGQPS
jgi:hypothetical protein